MQPLKLLIVDDHKVARDALVERLDNEADIQVKGVPATGPEVLNEAMNENPQVVLLDIKSCSVNGMNLCRDLVNNKKVKVIVLTSCLSIEEIEELKECGVESYLFKDLDLDSLLEMIRS